MASPNGVATAVPKYPNNLRALRRSVGISPRILAEKAGMPLPTYYGIQKGKLELTPARAEALAKVLECRPEDLTRPPVVVATPGAAAAPKPRRQTARAKAPDADLEKLITMALKVPKRKRGAAAALLLSFIDATR